MIFEASVAHHIGKELRAVKSSGKVILVLASTEPLLACRCTPTLWKRCIGLALLILTPVAAAAQCVPFTEAGKHLGATRCVTGKVIKVTHSDQGTTFLNFCDDYRRCPFQVVVFRSDLPHVGDVRNLAGKTIEIHGKIEDYDGHTEIILKRPRQLRGDGAKIPPLPKGFDVENKGRYSAGRLSHPKSASAPRQKRQSRPIQMEDPELAEE
jgi:hypothetical protein